MIGWLAAALAALVLVPAWLITPIAPQLMGDAVRRVETTEKVVALTFDDGPDEQWTPAVLDMLARNQVQATFFVMGSKVAQFPAITKMTWEAGHEVGNHSWSHPLMVFKPEELIKEEIEKTDALLHELGYTKEIYFRAPCGLKFLTLPRVLTSLQKKHILFDVIAWDWTSPGAQKIVQNVMKDVRPGSIILLHDGCGTQLDKLQAAEQIIVCLKSQGFRFVTISELLTYRHT
jgi:peptidoglycan/xylan/chitin deacetylase (PgdA/CDA1 family)